MNTQDMMPTLTAFKMLLADPDYVQVLDDEQLDPFVNVFRDTEGRDTTLDIEQIDALITAVRDTRGADYEIDPLDFTVLAVEAEKCLDDRSCDEGLAKDNNTLPAIEARLRAYIAGDVYQQALADVDLADHRKMYHGSGELTDYQLDMLLSSTTDDLDDWSAAYAMAKAVFYPSKEAPKEGAVMGSDLKAETAATRMAQLAIDDEQFQTDVRESLWAVDVVARGPAQWLLDLERVYGGKLDEFPHPGTKKAESNNPDIGYSEHDTKASWYNDFADSMPAAKAIRAQINLLDRTKDSDPNTSAAEAEAIKKSLARKLTSCRALLKNAMRLYWKMEALRDLDPDLHIGLITKADPVTGKVTLVSPARTIQAFRKSNPGQGFKTYGTPAIANLDLKKVRQIKQDTPALTGFDAMLKAMQRAQPDQPGAKPGQTAPETKLVIPSIAQVSDYANALNHYFEQPDSNKTYNRVLQSNASNDMVLALGDLKALLDGMWTSLEPRYKPLKAAADKAEMEAAENDAKSRARKTA